MKSIEKSLEEYKKKYSVANSPEEIRKALMNDQVLPYESILTKSLTKEFGKLPKSVKEKLLDALKRAADSRHIGTELRGKTGGDYGDWEFSNNAWSS